MALDVEAVHFCHHLLDVLNSRIAKLHHGIAVEADEVIVLPIPKRRLVFGLAIAKLMADSKLALQQHTKRVIDRGPANLLSSLLEPQI